MSKITWRNEKRLISQITPADYNPRMMTEQQAKDLSTSIERFDLADPLVINADNKLIGGHQRLTILKAKGVTEIDVRVPSRQLTEKEEQELNIRLNKNLGQWDFDQLANFDEEMLKDIGFDSKELDKIFQIEPEEKDDAVPQSAPAICKRGEIYQLGRHRLMCGDSTNGGNVALLMDGKKAAMIHTDPPYNVDYGVSKKPSHKIRTIENDKQSPEEWEAFCKSLFEIFKCFNDGDIYMWGASSPEGMRMRLWLVESGAHWSATIIWKKQQLVLSPAKYQRMYEPCFYGWFDKSSFGDDRTQTEVWDINRPLDSKLHPTMKPVELCEKAIINSSKRDDVVMDLFLGSGSTLIACEKSNRICYGMEIDPPYCDVIIKRWEDFTGLKAQLVNEVQTA
jgi:DNA modification methylase